MRKRIACALLALTLPLSACAAAPAELRSVTLPSASPLPPIEEKENPKGAELLPVYLDGLLTTRAYRKEDTVFIELRPRCAKAGIDMDWSGDEKSFTLTLDSLLGDPHGDVIFTGEFGRGGKGHHGQGHRKGRILLRCSAYEG